MITLKSCPVCESLSIIKYPNAGLAPHVNYEIMPGVQVKAAIITHYSVCQNCHAIFQNPRMSDEELNKFCSQGYYCRTVNMSDEEISRDEAYRAEVDAEIVKEHLDKVVSHLDVGSGCGYLLAAVGARIKVGVELDVDYVKVKGVEVYPGIDQVPAKKFDLITLFN